MSISTEALSLSHYSAEPVLAVYSVEQTWRHGTPSEYEKPKGLWLSVDGEDDWAAWCESEKFGIGSIRHRVELASGANILRCSDALDVRCLTERYSIDIPGSYSWRHRAVDWHRIAREYQGIIIAPYVWTCRLEMDTNWYYGWDCASGCIWDAAAVACIEPVREAA